MNKYRKMAWRNLWRNTRRTAIATVAIVLGLILLIFMDALIQGSDQAMFGNAVRLYGGNIQVHAPGYREKASRLPMIPLQDADIVVQAASAQPGVLAASKRINTAGVIGYRGGTHPVTIVAIQPSVEKPISLAAENITQGRFLLDEDESAIVIGKGLADYLGVGVGDLVNLLGRRKDESMRQHSMTIVGIYDLGLAEAEIGMVFIPLSEAQTLYNLRDEETEVAISLDDLGQEDGLIAVLQSELPGYEVDSWQTLNPEIQQTMQIKSTFTNIFGFVVLLIASIGILNLMLMAAFERTREMGVLAALGWKGRQIMALFLLEGMFIGSVGGVVGCVLSGVLIFILARVGIDFSFASGMGGEAVSMLGDRIYPLITLGDIAGYFAAVIVIAALASLLPAWQASRNEPAEALHYV